MLPLQVTQSTVPTLPQAISRKHAALRYLGAAEFVDGPAGTVDADLLLPSSKINTSRQHSRGSQSAYSIEFGTDSRYIEFRTKSLGSNTRVTNNFRLALNGQPDNIQPRSAEASAGGQIYFVRLDLGSKAGRTVRLDMSFMPFGGLHLDGDARIWGPPARDRRLLVIGDSLCDGSGNNAGGFLGASPSILAARRNLIVWDQAIGGTGYIATNGYAAIYDRLATDVVPYLTAGSSLILWGGFNDKLQTPAAITTAAQKCFAYTRELVPQLAIGCWSNSVTPSSQIVATDEALRNAARGSAAFASPVTGKVYNFSGELVDNIGPWITAETVGLIGGPSDTTVHPGDELQARIAARLSAVADIVGLPL